MYRTGFVALIGLPNAGKSTLMNVLVGEKVAIVSPKPQTTRKRVIGILNRFDDEPKAQLIFVDSPGVLETATSDLNRFLQQEYHSVIEDSDFILAVLNADEKQFHRHEKVIALAQESQKPWAAIVTKTDLVSGDEVAAFITQLKLLGAAQVLTAPPPSVEQLREDIVNLCAQTFARTHHPLYDEDIYTTQNLRDLAAEIIREKCFLHLHQEIPFGLAVKIQSFKESSEIIRIEADIVIERDSQKKIVIGKGGSTLKTIGTEARKELEGIIGTKIFLRLFVSTKPRWMADRTLMKELGYVHLD